MKGRKEEAVFKILELQRENDVIAMLLDGKTQKEIHSYIQTKYNLSPPFTAAKLAEGKKIIASRRNFEVNNLISIHIARYELIYSRLYEMKAYVNATLALKAKEKLLGFHKEGFHMKVTQGEVSAISLQSVRDEYNVMKLSEDKRNRMTALLQKASRKKKELN